MLAGHLGVALAAGRIEPRINLGILAAAALLLDLLLWLFVLAGWETVVTPADYAVTRQEEFRFPYSHSLVASLLWSAAAAALAWRCGAGSGTARRRMALIIAAVVFSHWLLDALVHRPELPLAGSSSLMIGAGLWNHLPLALAIEAAITLTGLWLLVSAAAFSRGRTAALAATMVVLLVFTIGGMLFAPPPPSAFAMAASSLALLVAACLLLGWLGRGEGATTVSRP
ncbi:MAG: hypothetical protein FJ191_13405 [Gammaproteobacteria bacterium]|nr:hypothetical protein [Gammaproteobacteria bacterium]